MPKMITAWAVMAGFNAIIEILPIRIFALIIIIFSSPIAFCRHRSAEAVFAEALLERCNMPGAA